MSLLESVADAREAYLRVERNLAATIIESQDQMRNLREALDVRMVYAVDWGNHSPTEVAMVAGYKSHAAIRDARKRIEKREAEVR